MNIIEQRTVKTPSGRDYLDISLVEMPKNPLPVVVIETMTGLRLRLDPRSLREVATTLTELAEHYERKPSNDAL